MKPFLDDNRGSAAIEFALVAPIAVLLVLGLADTVRLELAAMDVDAAASAGAMAAVSHRYDRRRIDAAITAHDRLAQHAIEVVHCDTPRAAACATLPPGNYARVTVQNQPSWSLGSLRSRSVVAVAVVRLP